MFTKNFSKSYFSHLFLMQELKMQFVNACVFLGDPHYPISPGIMVVGAQSTDLTSWLARSTAYLSSSFSYREGCTALNEFPLPSYMRFSLGIEKRGWVAMDTAPFSTAAILVYRRGATWLFSTLVQPANSPLVHTPYQANERNALDDEEKSNIPGLKFTSHSSSKMVLQLWTTFYSSFRQQFPLKVFNHWLFSWFEKLLVKLANNVVLESSERISFRPSCLKQRSWEFGVAKLSLKKILKYSIIRVLWSKNL